MIELLLIGMGTGNPDHLTLEAVKALNTADLILLPLKGALRAQLADVRREIVAGVVTNPATRLIEFDMPSRDASAPDYVANVEDWHRQTSAVWQKKIETNLGPKGRVALLVWGDPSLYDSTMRIAAHLAESLPLDLKVIPGITSIQALTAAHAIPLNEIGASVLLTTGRQLRKHGWPEGIGTLVVMLDGEQSFAQIDATGVTIWWGAYLGMPEEITISGPLKDVGAHILETRKRAREKHGWLMDIYILRRHEM